MWSEGDLGGLLPGEPKEDGGLVEGFGEGSGPAGRKRPDKRVLQNDYNTTLYYTIQILKDRTKIRNI